MHSAMTIANFRITACPKGEADQDDIDPSSPTGWRLTPEQQGQLDRACRLIEREEAILAALELMAMQDNRMSTRAIELLDYIRHGAALDEAAE